MSKILVTGTTGYLGRHVVPRLLQAGHIVYGVCRQHGISVESPADNPALTSIMWDGNSATFIKRCENLALDGAIHLATHYRRDHTAADVSLLADANLHLGMALLEVMSQQPGRRVVYTSTVWQDSHSDGTPVNLYAATKRAFSEILRYYTSAHGIEAVSLMMADTYGEGDQRPRFLNAVRKSLLNGQPLLASGGEQIIDLLHVDDVCEAIMHAFSMPVTKACEEFSVPSDELVNLRELVSRIERITGTTLNVTWGARPYAAREVFAPRFSTPSLPGWTKCISLDEGLRRVFTRPSGVLS